MRHKTNLSRVTPCVRVNISQETGVTGVTGVSVVDDKLIVARSDGSLETITLPAGGSTVDIDALLETIRAEIPALVDLSEQTAAIEAVANALRDAEARVGTNESNITGLQTDKADKDEVVAIARDGLQSEWQDAANQAKEQAQEDATAKAGAAKDEAIAEARELNNATKEAVESMIAALPTPVDERGVVTGRLVGSNLELVGEGDEVLATVALEALIPAAKADRFLSAVVYDQENKQLVFTTEAEGEDAQTITVPMADVIPVINVASTTQRGIVELATVTEAKTGTATDLAVTPAGLTAALAETKGAVDSANQRIQALEDAPTPVANDTYPTAVTFDAATRELVVKLNTGADLRLAWPVEQEEECTPIMLEANQELRAEVGQQTTYCRLADGSVVLREPKKYVYTVDRQKVSLSRDDVHVAYDDSGTRVPLSNLYYSSYDTPRGMVRELRMTTDDGDVAIPGSKLRYYVDASHPLLGGAEITRDEYLNPIIEPYEHQDDEERLYVLHEGEITPMELEIW